jgi:hypothetical protein
VANKNSSIAILVMTLVFEMALVGCVTGATSGGDSDLTDLNGTWVDSDGYEYTFDNGNLLISEGESLLSKGTYTTSGNSMTMTVSHVHGGHPGIEGMLESRWYTKSQYEASPFGMYTSDEGLSQIFYTVTGTYSISGNKLTLDGEIFTRK